MNFDYAAYEKVFTAPPTQTVTTDSAVEGYNPTADEANGKPNAADLETVAAAQPAEGANLPTQPAQPAQGINANPMGTAANMGANQPAEGAQPDSGGKGE